MSLVNLPLNYLRSVSSVVYLIEKTIDELKNMFIAERNTMPCEIINDLSSVERKNILYFIFLLHK